MYYFIRVILFTVLILSSSNKVLSWNYLVHYSIGRELGYTHELSGKMNLPDCWENRTFFFYITDAFCWSHGVQRRDSINFNPIPLIPIYPDDGRYPGRCMIEAVKKMNNVSADVHETIIGFRGHNAMDRIVHWSYFEGATSTSDSWKWPLHTQKEEWADFTILILFDKITFSSKSGKIKKFWSIDVSGDPNQIIVPLSGNARIIQIAQKIARKNRIKLDYNTEDMENPLNHKWNNIVESMDTIGNHINKTQNEMNNFIRDLDIDEYDGLIEKLIIYSYYGGTKELVTRYKDSIINAARWLEKPFSINDFYLKYPEVFDKDGKIIVED